MPTPSYEIPSDMRDMAEKSVDQASRAFDGFITAAQKAAGQADTTAATVQSNAKTMGTKAMGFAETNMRSAFDLARKLVRAKDPQEFLALQSDYLKSQMTVIQERAKELGSILRAEPQDGSQSVELEARTDLLDEAKKGSGVQSFRTTSGSYQIPPVDEAAFQASVRTMAELKGVEIARRDLAGSGGTYSSEELRRFLGIESEDEVHRLIDSRSILSVRDSQNKDRFPTFQFLPEGAIVDGIGSVMEALPTRNAWAILNFMIRPNSRLGDRRPIDLLKAGELAPVLEAARSMGVQGS